MTVSKTWFIVMGIPFIRVNERPMRTRASGGAMGMARTGVCCVPSGVWTDVDDFGVLLGAVC